MGSAGRWSDKEQCRPKALLALKRNKQQQLPSSLQRSITASKTSTSLGLCLSLTLFSDVLIEGLGKRIALTNC